MRVNLLLVALSGIAVQAGANVAHAKRAKPAEVAAPVESAAARAMRRAMADDTGARRDNDLRAPTLQTAAAGEVPETQERGPNELPKTAEATAPLSGVMEELIARQMQRNGAGLDRCVAELRARDPQLRGELTISVSVVQKRASATMAGSSVVRGDATFADCAAESTKTIRLTLPDLVFSWRVQLGR